MQKIILLFLSSFGNDPGETIATIFPAIGFVNWMTDFFLVIENRYNAFSGLYAKTFSTSIGKETGLLILSASCSGSLG